MGSVERSKKKVQLWKKAAVHFALCFVMGFFTGFAPSGNSKSSIFPSANHSSLQIFQYYLTPQPENLSSLPFPTNAPSSTESGASPGFQKTQNGIVSDEEEGEEGGEGEDSDGLPRKLIILITSTSSKQRYQEVFLRRLANTVRLIAPPLLWIVVEAQTEKNNVSEILRKTGIMYRHLVSKQNFTDITEEMDHQRNVALRHIEQHKLSGIVHFAGLNNVYDLAFFDELQEIEGFGTWPMALLGPNKKKVIIEGPVCDSSQVIGWHLKKINKNYNNNESEDGSSIRAPIHISSFAFNSSILWDPERWGRPSSIPHATQNSIKFVKEVALEDETKLKGIPPEKCSKIMLWQLKFSVFEKQFSDSISNISSDNNNR
ncbi:Nucleotide-diphospho-sugar transferases superfamily protein [Euphorbia peplus]|nr:Nucleotide-diphospho-sugar transferases superfamily protein [Euphorbia peplus]